MTFALPSPRCFLIPLALALGAPACSQADPATDGPPTPGAGAGGAAGAGATGGGGAGATGCSSLGSGTPDHFPLADGASWTYRHMGVAGGDWDETIDMAATTFGGAPAFLTVDTPDSLGVHDESVLVRQGTGTLRVHREEYTSGSLSLVVEYVPGFARFDEAWLTAGGPVLTTYSRTEADAFGSVLSVNQREQQYTVLATGECVQVPAGTFLTVKIERLRIDTQDRTLYWFADGVGKVREEQLDGSVEELVSYNIP